VCTVNRIKEEKRKKKKLCQRTQCAVKDVNMSIRYHLIRSAPSDGKVTIECCPTEEMMADVTKPVTKLNLEKLL